MKRLTAIILALILTLGICATVFAATPGNNKKAGSVKSGSEANTTGQTEKGTESPDEKDESQIENGEAENDKDDAAGTGTESPDGKPESAGDKTGEQGSKAQSLASASGEKPGGAAEPRTSKFSLGRVIRQDKPVEGDFVALAEDAEVSKGVGGDVYTLGRNVAVTDSKSVSNVAVAGVNVHVNVKEARNIYAAGVDLNVHADSADGMYLTGIGVTISGEVGEAVVAAGSIHVDGAVKGNLVLRSDNIIFGDNATVNGKLTIYSKKHPNLPSSLDETRVTYKAPSEFTKRTGDTAAVTGIRRITMIIMVSGVIGAILISLIINAYRPEFYKYKAEVIKQKFWVDLLRGLAAAIVIPIVGIALLFTYVGVPLGVLLLIGYAILLYIAPIITALVLSRAIFKHMNRFASGAICIFILYALFLVPYAGPIIALIAGLYGIGAAVGSIKLHTSEKQYPDKLSPAMI